jgi:hypothetical protein
MICQYEESHPSYQRDAEKACPLTRETLYIGISKEVSTLCSQDPWM